MCMCAKCRASGGCGAKGCGDKACPRRRERPRPLASDLVKVPGLFVRAELDDVITPDADFYVEPAGKTEDGTPLLAVYRRFPQPARHG